MPNWFVRIYAMQLQLIISVVMVTLLFFIGVMHLAWRAYSRPVVTGREAMIGQVGEIEIDGDQIWVHLWGECWQAHSKVALHQREKVKIINLTGLILEVEPLQSIYQERQEL